MCICIYVCMHILSMFITTTYHAPKQASNKENILRRIMLNTKASNVKWILSRGFSKESEIAFTNTETHLALKD